ncbi:hypothetical protein [Streptomyces sp. NPDC051994]|uniref:hypothetical protein n=1 Tax=unclassified Streptomyces TaxID=2593676 RepID=UPI0034216AC1
MVNIFDGLTPEDLGIKQVPAEVAEARSKLADQVRGELRKAGLPACRRAADDSSPGVKIEVDFAEDGPAAWLNWQCDPSVHAAFDPSRPDGGPAFQYFVQAAGHMQTTVLAILRDAGFTVEQDDLDPLVLLILSDSSA